MLINLSNHPSKYWGEKQMVAACKLWGSVVDIPFPQVDPEWEREIIIDQVDKWVDELCSKIQQYTEASAFHIMGESVFCFHLINRLKAKGYCVVASTANRVVEYSGEDKISHFEFVKFREY